MRVFQSFLNLWRERICSLPCLIIPDSLKDIGSCDVLLFCHDVNRPIILRGKAYSPLLDSIREDLESRGLLCGSVAHYGSSLTGIHAYFEPVSLNRSHFWNRLKRKIGNLLGITAIFKDDPYVRVLEKTGAQLVVTIGSPPDLASAARSKGVFHVELLHGIGYTFLPWGWDKLSLAYLPQGILSLDEISTSSFKTMESKGIDIYTIPHPFLKRFIFERARSLPTDWNISTENLNKYSKHILLSLTWGYSGDHGQYIEFANILSNGLFFTEVQHLVEEENGVFWHFRFHPVQLRQSRYKNLLKFMDDFVSSHPNSDWREASRVPFPSLAMHCDGNISMSSMSCYDAAAMGVPSLMLCPNVQKGGIHQDWFSDLENEGYVTKFEVDKRRIRRWVHQTHKIKPRLSNLDNDGAWEDAVEWMLEKSGLEARTKRLVPG